MTAWPFLRAHVQAFAVMREVSGQRLPAVVRGVTGAVTAEDSDFAIESSTGRRMVRARLYLPANRPHAPAMVLFHGVAETLWMASELQSEDLKQCW